MRKKILVRLISSILIMIMAVCSIVVIYLTVSDDNQSVFGYRLFVIKTGSMEGTLEIDDLIIAKKAAKEQLKVDTIISFISSDPDILGKVNTHRIVEIKDDFYYTKGDAADFIDPLPVKYEDVLGKLAWKSALAGKALMWLAKPLHMLFFVILPTILMMYLEMGNGAEKIRRFFSGHKKNANQNSEQEILKLLLVQTSDSVLPAALQELVKESETTEQAISNKALSEDIMAILSKEAYMDKLTNQFMGEIGGSSNGHDKV